MQGCKPSKPPLAVFLPERIDYLVFDQSMTDRPTDGRSNGPTDRRTDPLTEMCILKKCTFPRFYREGRERDTWREKMIELDDL